MTIVGRSFWASYLTISAELPEGHGIVRLLARQIGHLFCSEHFGKPEHRHQRSVSRFGGAGVHHIALKAARVSLHLDDTGFLLTATKKTPFSDVV
jgi:hypothetical protein